jgi:hypothetical protein
MMAEIATSPCLVAVAAEVFRCLLTIRVRGTRVSVSLTHEDLTALLRRSGVLPAGVVSAIREETNPAFNSRLTHLSVDYSEEAPESAPGQLVLKRSLPAAWAVRAGAREVAFYRLAASLPAPLPMLVPCYAAEHDETSSYLLLKDVSATHHAPLTRDQQLTPGKNVPSALDLGRTVDTLARFHAFWWEHPSLGAGAAEVDRWLRDRSCFEGLVQRHTGELKDLFAVESAWFPAELKRLYERVLASLPCLWDRHWEPRLMGRRQVTLIHGDAYFANFLCPNDPTSGETYLIDWQSPSTHLGAQDLVNLCATFWTRAQRAEGGREEGVLRRYHEGLLANGVRGYHWDDLLTDYRLALAEWLFCPVHDRAEGSARSYWWPKLQCLADAFVDRDGADLLE